MRICADGQLAASAAAIYTSDKHQQVNVVLQNTSGSSSETVLLTLTRTGEGTTRRIARAVLAANEQLVVNGVPMAVADVLKAQATDATTVDYVVLSPESYVPLSIQTLDANGAVKQVNTGVSGDQTISGTLTVGTNLVPDTSDGAGLGTASLMFSDLFLASGAVINFNNGDVTVTHSANTLALAGASSGYTFDAAPLPATDDGAALGSAAARWSDLFLAEGGVINWDGGDVTITQTNNVLAIASTTSTTFDGQVNPATNDAASLGTTALGWSDLHLATGGVINWANGEVTITETDANTLTVAGTTLVNFGATTINVTGTRIVTSYHTNLVSTNAVTVDSSELVKDDVARYRGDALKIIDGVDVITYKHDRWLDPTRETKLGVRAESVSESLAIDRIPFGDGREGDYPGVNTYALAALHTRAIQQLAEEVRSLKAEKSKPRS